MQRTPFVVRDGRCIEDCGCVGVGILNVGGYVCDHCLYECVCVLLVCGECDCCVTERSYCVTVFFV